MVLTMFKTTIENIKPDQVTRYEISRDGEPLSYCDVLDLWEQDKEFRSFYKQLLAQSPYDAYRWETPALTNANVNQVFQFVLLNSP